jgi:xyloglucan-specific exo-beta-1,4-glucanase
MGTSKTVGTALFALIMVSLPSVVAAANPVAVPYIWRNITVGGGGFAPGVVFSLAERGLAYLRTDMGGAYRWDARTARWIPLQDGNPVSSYMGGESIAPDPVDPNVVYLAAGMGWRDPAAILRSADRGADWVTVPVPFKMGGNEDGRGMGERLAINPKRTASLMFGSRHDGLWRSDDSGARWAKVAGFPLAGLGLPTSPRATHGGLSFVLYDRAHPGRIYVASADPGARHLFRSDDDGASWSAITGGPESSMLPVKAVQGSDGVLTITYANGIGPNGITRGAVWRFDGPAKWTDITPDKRANAPIGGYMGVAVSAQNPNVIAVSTVDRYKPVDTVWRSVDAGANWDELYTRSTRDISATPFLALDGAQADFGHWIAGLAIDPFDAGHAAYVTGATMYATDSFDKPGMMRWAPWTRGMEQTAIITLVSPTAGAPLITGFGDIAGFRHDDLSVSPPHMMLNPHLTSTNTLDYAGRAPQIMVRSGNRHVDTDPAATLAWSGDGGESWTPLMPAGTAEAPIRTGDAPIVVSADGATFLVESAKPVLSRDRGRNWQPAIGLPPRARPVADKFDARRFYVVDTASNQFLRSEDGGARWKMVVTHGLPADLSGAKLNSREQQSPLRATPGTAGALWLRLGGDLYRSADYGNHWARTGGTLSISNYGIGKAAPGARWPALYAIGDRAGQTAVLRSTDGGESWVRINDNEHQWGLRFRVIDGDPKLYGRVYVGTDGRGIVYGDVAR